jgi:hypothetical protein
METKGRGTRIDLPTIQQPQPANNGQQFIPYALAINIMIGSIIILIGSRLNPDTRDTDLD